MKRWEPLALLTLFLTLTISPFFVKELYPISLPTMFSAAPRQLAEYTVIDGKGELISLERVGLHIPEWHDPPVRTLGRNGYGRPIKPGVHFIGDVASAETIAGSVQRAWSADPDLPDPLEVRQEVYARGRDGDLQRVANHVWRWSRSDLMPGPGKRAPAKSH